MFLSSNHSPAVLLAVAQRTLLIGQTGSEQLRYVDINPPSSLPPALRASLNTAWTKKRTENMSAL